MFCGSSGRPAGNLEVKISAMAPTLNLPVGACTSGSVVKWPVGIRIMSSRGSRMAVVGTTFIGSLSRNFEAQRLFWWRPVMRVWLSWTLCVLSLSLRKISLGMPYSLMTLLV